jgi:hypothetical protein
VSAELRFQVANVYGTHTHIITNLTMLVMSVLAFRYAKAAPARRDPLSYDGLRQQILRRDDWRCQS